MTPLLTRVSPESTTRLQTMRSSPRSPFAPVAPEPSRAHTDPLPTTLETSSMWHGGHELVAIRIAVGATPIGRSRPATSVPGCLPMFASTSWHNQLDRCARGEAAAIDFSQRPHPGLLIRLLQQGARPPLPQRHQARNGGLWKHVSAERMLGT